MCRELVFKNCQKLCLTHDDVVFLVNGDCKTRETVAGNLVANLDDHLGGGAVCADAVANFNNLKDGGLFLGLVGKDDAALGLFLGFKLLKNYSVAYGLIFILIPPIVGYTKLSLALKHLEC